MSTLQLDGGRLKIAVIGAGISGLSAAWLLSKRHDVTIYEQCARLGGHANTHVVETPSGAVPIDTGFIVYNPKNYPNLVALFSHLGVETAASDMSFSVSADEGDFEYGGGSLASLVAQKRNLARPVFWSMMRGLVRFYREAPQQLENLEKTGATLGEYLQAERFGKAFETYHLLPMAGAIWSAPPEALRAYPAASFIRFFQNHDLLSLGERSPWRTVAGGSQAYVKALAAAFQGTIRTRATVRSVVAGKDGVGIISADGHRQTFDHVLLACHSDQALALLPEAAAEARAALAALRYTTNEAILHTDERLMPKRRAAWASWNFLGDGLKQPASVGTRLCVSYWMNRLQPLPTQQNYFVTLNPTVRPADDKVVHRETYAHPLFDAAALTAQKRLLKCNGQDKVWFCGAYLGAGFHEDGLRSGLDAAEVLGGIQRPWGTISKQNAKAKVAA